LWLVHLVQLKKLFLKLSAYVELYLKQDWSLLPVPDFKLVARSDLVTGHLNFMVAAVLLTATHSGKNLEFERILELVIPTGLRKDIQLIQDAFIMALEPKTATNSPRRTSLTTTNVTGITPKVLFPTNLSISLNENDFKETFEFNEIKLQEIKEELVISDHTDKTKVEEEEYTVDYTEIEIIHSDIPAETTSSTAETSYRNDEINLRNEIKLMEIKLEEMEKVLNSQKESEILKTRNLFEIIEELRNLKERQEYEKIERNSLMAAFDQEKQILDDQIEILRKENYEANEKLLCLTNENEELKRDQENKKDFVDINLHNLQVMTDELNQSKHDNSKLVKALKKARDHILKQDSMIKELKENLEESEKTRKEEIKILKESFEFERNEMNRVLIDLGGKIQRTNLLNLQQQQQQ
jgi:hypothetical protein